MLWRLRNLNITIEDYTDVEARWLSKYLTYKTLKVYTDDRGKLKRNERLVSLFIQLTDDFPTGVGPVVFKAAKARGFQVRVVDERVKPCEPDPSADLQWLRRHPAVSGEVTHQVEAVEAAVKKKRGIIWVPTGGGKGEIAIGLTRKLPCQWLFLVHKVDLLKQQADRYETRTGLAAGVVGDGRFDIPDGCRFVVMSFQTAYRGLQEERVDISNLVRTWAEGIFVDECHALGASTFWNTVMRAKNAYYRFGFSGTPLARSDDRNLLIVGGLGPVIYRVMPQTLIDLGLLATPDIRMVEVQHKPKGQTWSGVYTACVVKSTNRNNRVVDVVKRASKPALVFVHRVEHGRDLVKRLEKVGMNARFAWGAKSTAQRKELLTQLERGYIDALVCNDIFHEGIDVPSLRAVVVASGMKSPIAVVQRMGRGMRADAGTGKDRFEVWDIADVGCGCVQAKVPVNDDPLLDDPTAPTTHPACRWLEKHARARRKAYEKEGFTVQVEPQVEPGDQMGLPGTG